MKQPQGHSVGRHAIHPRPSRRRRVSECMNPQRAQKTVTETDIETLSQKRRDTILLHLDCAEKINDDIMEGLGKHIDKFLKVKR